MYILLVDDEEELVQTLAERLGFRGIEAEWATSAETALELVREKHFDIAVLDVKMPRISGIELMGMLKEQDPALRFVFLTGHGSEADFRQGSESGACFYLMKPVKLERLVEKLEEAIDGNNKHSPGEVS
ncbi:MAG: response regulator [Deltaproteobacteria bacterium]|nr:MAG: response regulator [Deltaproteobacteria bacterium]